MTTEPVKSKLTRYKAQIDEFKAQKSILEKRFLKLSETKDALTKRHEHILKAREVLTLVARQTQQNLEVEISDLVTMAFAIVFQEPYEFRIKFEERRNTTEADLLFVVDDQEIDPLESSGGGLVDIASFGLRVAFWKLSGKRPVMILDEPFRNLSPDLQSGASEMLHRVSKELGIQIIMVSHAQDINEKADRIFRVTNGKVRRIDNGAENVQDREDEGDSDRPSGRGVRRLRKRK